MDSFWNIFGAEFGAIIDSTEDRKRIVKCAEDAVVMW
jgi:heme oxygenase